MLAGQSSLFYIPSIRFIIVQQMTSNTGSLAQQIALLALPQALCSFCLLPVLQFPFIWWEEEGEG